MSKAEKTRNFIIEKSAPIFNKKGYTGTSLADLINATGLTKGSIYGNFENKDEVAVAVYKYNVKMLSARFNEAVNAQKTATNKFIAFIDYYRNSWENTFEKGGCPILNASIEADDNLPFLKKSVQASIRSWIHWISAILNEGIKSKEFRSGITTSEYAYITITIIEGGIMLAKIENNPERLFSALDRVIKIFNEEIKQ